MYKYNIILLIIILIFLTLLINKQENFKSSDIPKKIFLSFKTKDVPEFILDNWKNLNPGYEITLSDNNDCKQFLLENYSEKYVELFDFLEDGPIKADFWRVCILYKYGGVYADIDIELLVPLDYLIDKEPDVSFITCNSLSGNLNPHFILTVPQHPILKKCIEEYIRKYESGEIYSYWGYSITGIMHNTYKQMVGDDVREGIYTDKRREKYMIITEEGEIERLSEVYCSYKRERILNNRHKSYDPLGHKFVR